MIRSLSSRLPGPLSFAVGLLVLGLFSGGCDRSEKQSSPAPPETPAPSDAAAPPSTSPPAPTPEEKPKPARPEGPLNVIFLTVDALRSDMPWAGYDKPIAPHLTRLAEKSVVYENHRSVSSYTAQTVATWLSGRFASTLYRTGVFFTNYFDSNDWITESMQAQGVRTMAVHAHLYFDRAPGLKQGFDVYQMVPGLTWNAQTDESVTSEKSSAAILKLLSDPELDKKPFFLWSHLMDPHDKYVKHKEAPDFDDDNRGRYDSEVWFTDREIGKIIAFAEQQPWWEKTALIVSADHGEAFGEHGMYKHAFELWEVLTRVPLIVHAPGAAPKRISAPRTHIDIAPTVLDLLRVSGPAGLQGQSLAPEIFGEVEPESREPIVLELAEDTNNPARRALIRGAYKLIVLEGWKKLLFNLADDPGELHDLADKEPEKVKELEAELRAYFEKLPVVAPFGGNKLRSGKLATGPKGPPAAPKKP